MAKRRAAPIFTRAELTELGYDVDAELEARNAPAPNATAPNTKPAGKWDTVNARARRHPGAMNATERRFYDYLEERRARGMIRWHRFEGVTFRLGRRSRYEPDWIVVDADGLVRAIEVKGTAGWALDSESRTKWKAAAETFRWVRFEAATLCKDGSWDFEHYEPRQPA